ncbi:hypothetical protein HN51_024488 [Arachis hypogaea]|uniref:Uncharacterized protein n=1 Tax=Arachis hypogaea TaxID=3818 RepID=A0A445C692_ARAHY|nr:putative proline-rich receptor-like protein kinase PERK11 [Arachis hypogaea]QHO27530.1 putative receptor-like protein kinase [Arachis hypogaea]RYR46452.1 hypothetical protein Ahy_A07g032191 [Arachis hypogaea]
MSESSLKTLGITVAILVCVVIWYLSVYYFLKKWKTVQVRPGNEHGGGDQEMAALNQDGHGHGGEAALPENDPPHQEPHFGAIAQGQAQEHRPHHHEHLPLLLDGSSNNADSPRTDKVEPIQDRTLPPLDELKETTVNSGDEDARALGTFGYDAPEYAMSGKLNSKSALHSLGVVLQKLLVHALSSGQQSLFSRAFPKHRHCLDEKLGAVAMYVRYEEAVF